MTLLIGPAVFWWCALAAKLEKVPMDWKSMKTILTREHGGMPSRSANRSQNRRSTAFGLGQFLNSTWRGTGISKTTDPVLQLRAMYRYIRSRYGTPAKAARFHRQRGWY